MHSDQCRNALLDHHQLDIHNLLWFHLPAIFEDDDTESIRKRIEFLLHRELPQFWGREQLNALQHDIEWKTQSRVHVAYDPYWYFQLEIDDKDSDDEKSVSPLKAQKYMVKNRGNGQEKERSIKDLFHFLNDSDFEHHQHDQSARYNLSSPMEVDGYTNSYREHLAMHQVSYYHVPKCGSSSIRKMLSQIGGTRVLWTQSLFDGYAAPSSLVREIECGFTFVRHPIHRFISAYYTLNMMLRLDSRKMSVVSPDKLEAMKGDLKHWDMVDHCYFDFSCFERLYVFIQQLVDDSWKWIGLKDNVLTSRVMEHVGSVSGHFMAAFDGWNLDYVGKVEQFGEHWHLLSRNISECSTGYLERYWQHEEGDSNGTNGTTSRRRLRRSGKEKEKKKKKSNVDEDGVAHNLNGYGQKGHHSLNRTLVDAYYALAMDRTAYDKLAEYYYQDSVCFDYDTSYESFMEYIRLHDPAFDPKTLRPPATGKMQ